MPKPIFEDDLKNRSRDIASGSLVFSQPKIGGASGKPLPESFYKLKLNLNSNSNYNLKLSLSVYQLQMKGVYIVKRCS